MAKSRSLTIDPSAYAKFLKAIKAEIAAGRRAKRFVEKVLNPCPFIVVKTYKDQSDKYGPISGGYFLPGLRDRRSRRGRRGRILEPEAAGRRLGAGV